MAVTLTHASVHLLLASRIIPQLSQMAYTERTRELRPELVTASEAASNANPMYMCKVSDSLVGWLVGWLGIILPGRVPSTFVGFVRLLLSPARVKTLYTHSATRELLPSPTIRHRLPVSTKKNILKTCYILPAPPSQGVLPSMQGLDTGGDLGDRMPGTGGPWLRRPGTIHLTLHHAMPYHAMPYHAIPCHTILPYHTT